MREITAKSTAKGENRFEQKLYLRVLEGGVISPVDYRRRRSADVEVTMTFEYPTYEEELRIRERSTKYDSQNQIHYTDYALLTEERVRRVLVKWDLHEKVPNLTRQLHRVIGLLEDDSLELWKSLPPLVRKAIADKVNLAIGSI